MPFFRSATGVCAALALATSALASPWPAAHEQMLRQLIGDTVAGRIQYQTLDPGLAIAVKPQAALSRSELVALGALKSVRLERTDDQGFAIYRTVFEKGELQWAFRVNAKGLIDNAAYRPVKPGPS
jgi:hypothetical protein